MTKLLEQAFARASELPQEEQDKFARFLLAGLESERRWAENPGGDKEAREPCRRTSKHQCD